MDKIIWGLRQLLPLKYASTYGQGDSRYNATWRMWFGKCFNVKTVVIGQ